MRECYLLCVILLIFTSCEDDNSYDFTNDNISVSVNVGDGYLTDQYGNELIESNILISNSQAVFIDTSIASSSSYVFDIEDEYLEPIDFTLLKSFRDIFGNKIYRLTTFRDIGQSEINFRSKDIQSTTGAYYLTIIKDYPFLTYNTANLNKETEINNSNVLQIRFELTEGNNNLLLFFYNQNGDVGKYFYSENITSFQHDTILASQLIEVSGIPFSAPDNISRLSFSIYGLSNGSSQRVKFYEYDSNALWPSIPPTILVPDNLFSNFEYDFRVRIDGRNESRIYKSNELLTSYGSILEHPSLIRNPVNEFYLESSDSYEYYKVEISFDNAPVIAGLEDCFNWTIYGKYNENISLDIDEIIGYVENEFIDSLCSTTLEVGRVQVYRIDELNFEDYNDFINVFTDENINFSDFCNSLESSSL